MDWRISSLSASIFLCFSLRFSSASRLASAISGSSPCSSPSFPSSFSSLSPKAPVKCQRKVRFVDWGKLWLRSWMPIINNLKRSNFLRHIRSKKYPISFLTFLLNYEILIFFPRSVLENYESKGSSQWWKISMLDLHTAKDTNSIKNEKQCNYEKIKWKWMDSSFFSSFAWQYVCHFQ